MTDNQNQEYSDIIDKDIQKLSFWALATEETANRLATDTEKGLSETEARRRQKIFGKNIIENNEAPPAIKIFLNQLKSPLIFMLIIAGATTLFINHLRDAGFIFAAVIVNTALGFYQEYKANKAIAELKTYIRQRARVVREGKNMEVDAIDLVPGDIVRLSQGDRVPADGRIIYSNDIQVDEAILTGESLPVEKQTNPVDINTVLAEQKSMLFAGTLITQGVATLVICRTDFSTEIGKIAELITESKTEETPLQKAIKRFSIRAGIFLTALTIIIFGMGILIGHSWVEMFLISVAVAVSAIPEGLPIAMTVILAVGVQRMAKRKGVVKKLIAAEALGSATVILTDKTGTLTMANMDIGKILPVEAKNEKEILELALINSNVIIENPEEPPQNWRITGRTIEVSLVNSAAKRGVNFNKEKIAEKILDYLPFNAVNKFSVSIIKGGGDKKILVFFGAPDILIEQSALKENERIHLIQTINQLAESGELVMGVATKEINIKDNFNLSQNIKANGLTLEGLITLRDPIRPGIKKAIKKVEDAGVRTIIMTGDHRGTALAVAREIGIEVSQEEVIDASELKSLSDEDLKIKLPALKVISRVSPADKLKMVLAFQNSGEVVAMTGDGINDAPSIKRADIGISMGSGTEVTRDVADLVLLDDNFETIAAAIEEGRQILGNIRKALVYLLSNVLDALILIGGSILTGISLPLNALQILWVNFFSDSFPAIAFAFEKDGYGSLVRKKNATKTELFTPLMNYLIAFIGISTSALLFILYWILLKIGFPEDIVKTFIFMSFGTYTLFLTLSVRSLEKSIFSYPFFSNKYLLAGVIIGLLLMSGAVYIPFLQTLFGTVHLSPIWISGVVGIGLLNILLIEIGKWIFRRKQNSYKIKTT